MAVTETEIYQQQCAEFRALNAIFWQVPVIMMTLNGGLWFALGNLELAVWGQRCLLWFAALTDVGFIIALIRLRLIMQSLRESIRAVEGGKSPPMAWVTCSIFSLILGFAAVGALVASGCPQGVLTSKPRNSSQIAGVSLNSTSMPPTASASLKPALSPNPASSPPR